MSRKTERKQLKMRLVKIVSLALAICVFAGLAQHYVLCRLDAHGRRIEGFYMEPKNSLDMVMLGSSEIYNAFVPTMAWKSDGFTSYMYGYQANPVSLWKYQLREIERTQDPQVLLIECNGAVYDKEQLDNPAEVRFMTDDMPMSLNKIRLIREKAVDPGLSYYLPILKYHGNRFSKNGTLSKIMLEKRGYHISRGAQARVTSKKIKNIVDVKGDDSVAELDPAAESELMEFLAACKASDIPHIVFVRVPHVETKDTYIRYQRYHRVKQIVEENGFDYLDLDESEEEMGISPKKDYVDGEHLNANGARKMTAYLAPYLKEQYQIQPAAQTEKLKKTWEESADYYDRMYEYWCWFKENYPDVTRKDSYDVNDNYESQKRIEAYFSGHPLPVDLQ